VILMEGGRSSIAVLVVVSGEVPSVGVTVPFVFLPVEADEMDALSDLSPSRPMALRKRSLNGILAEEFCEFRVVCVCAWVKQALDVYAEVWAGV